MHQKLQLWNEMIEVEEEVGTDKDGERDKHSSGVELKLQLTWLNRDLRYLSHPKISMMRLQIRKF